MRSILSVAFCAILIAGASIAGGVSASSNPDAMTVDYDFMGPDGVLTLTAPSGMPFCAYDANGVAVVSGTVDGETEVYSSNAGVDAGGMMLIIHIGGEVLMVGEENGYSDWWF